MPLWPPSRLLPLLFRHPARLPPGANKPFWSLERRCFILDLSSVGIAAIRLRRGVRPTQLPHASQFHYRSEEMPSPAAKTGQPSYHEEKRSDRSCFSLGMSRVADNAALKFNNKNCHTNDEVLLLAESHRSIRSVSTRQFTSQPVTVGGLYCLMTCFCRRI